MDRRIATGFTASGTRSGLPARIATLLVLVIGCGKGGPPEAPPGIVARPDAALAEARAAPGAFDVLKLCRFSDEEGPVYFAHDLHARLTDADGETVTCVRCHHTLAQAPDEPPFRCSTCHPNHDHAKPGILST